MRAISMEVYATEEQQVEAIKGWFKKHGNKLLWAIIMLMLAISAVRYWHHHQGVLKEEAADHYLALMTALEQKDEATVNNKAQSLMKDYPHSSYATFAAFALTDEALKNNELAKAQENLEWVLQQNGASDLQSLARIRLMRVLIAQDKLEEALALCDEKQANGFIPLLVELKGDILFKQGKIKEARTSYQQAVTAAPEQGMYGPLLKMKLEDLGDSLEPATDKEANK